MRSKLNHFFRSKTASFVLPFLATILLFVVWEIVVRVFQIPQFNLPSPSSIYQAAVNYSPQILANAWRTLVTTTTGFLIAIATGVFLGFLIGYSRIAYLTLYPILVGFNTIPKVALVPLLAVWFGANEIPATLTAFLLAFFPIAVNVALGLDTVEPEMKDVLRSLGASQLEVFQKVGWPHTLPYLFASLKIAASFAFVGSVIAESVASNGGMGYLIVVASSNFDVPLAFAGLLALAVLGIVLYGFFVILEKYAIYWAR
ncbi:ABC transporter permease [Gloeocapsopsis crepidinum LEGE 06123]|uniref:ABC transporter permease n=1 Tax=Gloeocapsopsis crepidinum LEGE 06123 TaxID=588587 RepID=A0ABR9UZG1_9CHRO|nr:ABC transporter permease [Gloeocapsopsis crepidinum]MBE9193674.1 ABC transporter permease [Gloeocapsopsis crepidinum LEGE 06123]